MKLEEIHHFERMNPTISVNVFGLDEERKCVIGPYFITSQEKQKHINLLLLQKDEVSHYVWIKIYQDKLPYKFKLFL